ncbi:hypothetical protein [Microbacterium shaanxiense]
MSTDITTSDAPGVARRTVLKASAWSVPVIAAAVATPLAAASVATDLRLEALPFGDGLGAQSPDGLRQWSIGVPGAFSIFNDSSATVPVGTVVTASSDARVLGDPTFRLDSSTGTEVPRASSQTTGNIVTSTFTIPAEIPAGGSVSIYGGFGVWQGAWYDDVNPYVLSVLAAGDPTPENNVVTMSATYVDTNDGSVTAQWSTATIMNEFDASTPYAIDVPTSFSLTSLAPGGTSPEISFDVRGPQVYVGEPGAGGGWEDAFTGATITSAQLDGVDVSSDIVEESPLGFWLRNTSIAAGQTLTVTLTMTMNPGPIRDVYLHPGASIQTSIHNDRDSSNNRVYSPNYVQ